VRDERLLTICSVAHQAQSQAQLAKFVKGGLFDGGIQAQHLCRGQHAQLLADVGVQQLQGCRVGAVSVSGTGLR
jgi:hypothetical protein